MVINDCHTSTEREYGDAQTAGPQPSEGHTLWFVLTEHCMHGAISQYLRDVGRKEGKNKLVHRCCSSYELSAIKGCRSQDDGSPEKSSCSGKRPSSTYSDIAPDSRRAE